MFYRLHTLSNGLRIAHLPADSPVSYCGFAVQAGARDEAHFPFGLAHFVEHMLFKGTTRRKSWHILNRMENVGGELNAYTTKEETFAYAIFMEEHYARAFDLLADIAFHSQFPPQEVEKETEVIRDEINSYKDSPSELIFDDFENQLFCGHELGHNILGDEQSLSAFTAQAGKAFMRRFYVPQNMLFFSMGRKDFGAIVRLAEQALGGIRQPFTRSPRQAPQPVAPSGERMKKDTHQAHVLIGTRTCSMFDDNRMPLFLFNNILGGPGMNSRLNIALREKNGLAYNVESNLACYTDTGQAGIYFGTDPKNLDKALRLTHKILASMRDERLSPFQLAAAKKQLSGQLGVSGDNHESRFLGFGKSILHRNRYDSLSELFAKIEQVTASDIQDVANRFFSPSNLSSLIYLAP
jgi:predicted Zn-dependent peptidase